MSQRITVVFVISGLGVGGIEYHLARQLRFFNRNRYKLHLVALSARPSDGSSVRDLIPSDVGVHKFSFSSVRDISNLIRLGKLFRHIRPDIVVSSAFDANTIVRILKPFLGYRVISREHSITIGKPKWQYIVDRLLRPLSFALVTVSKSVADYASEQSSIPRERFMVIYNGVDLDHVTEIEKGMSTDVPRLRTELRLKPEEKIILSIGRLKEQKNHKLLIEGFSLFSRSHPEYRLIIIGDGDERPALERKVRERNLKKKVIFTGARADALHFYPLCECSVITSPYEGFPNACIESLAFGKPVVSTRAGGVMECITNGINGFLIDGMPDAVAKGLEHITKLNVAEYAQMGDVCHRTARRFSLKHNVAQYEALFERATKALS